MTIFLDANILVSVLNNEYPAYTYTSRILSLAGTKNYIVCTSPICLAIAFYFAEKKSNAIIAKKNITKLIEKLRITSVGKSEVEDALKNKKITDFEDGLQYYSAITYNVDAIITEDLSDYYFSTIPIYNSKLFFEHIVSFNK
ncbi:type II toxin-antitoxin system VapC family toxin [Ferruginibacter sp.]|nr:PIN domain-containing protein [Ferruginibacter sp.]